MGLSRLEQLYRHVIVDHSSHPHNYGELEDPTHAIKLHNPTCGDTIEIQVHFVNDCIQDIRFSGNGCAISKASASMMTDIMKNKTKKEAQQLIDAFSLMMLGEEPEKEEAFGDAIMLQTVSKFPARIKCATLAWKALEKALDTE